MGAGVDGLSLRDDAGREEMPYQRRAWRPVVRRGALPAAGACCDIAAWMCALLAAAWISADRGGPGLTASALWTAALTACLLQAGYGLAVRLYLGRYQRGSFEEIIGVGTVVVATAV